MKRWCIIAGARSGSTWLEELIHNGFLVRNYQIKLGEPLEHSSDYFKSSGHNHSVALNEFGYLCLERLTDKTFENNSEYLDYLIDTFRNANKKQNVVLKVFPQDWKYSEDDYIRFLSALEEFGFQFINLSRKITDRAISWQMMQQSKIVHRWIQGDRHFYSTMQGADNNVTDLAPKSVTLDVKTFIDYMNLTAKEDELKNRIAKRFNCININYETLIGDCDQNRIIINQDTKVQKLYSTSYKDAIANYGEIVEVTNQTEFIQKYGKNSQLKNAIVDTACQFAWDYTVLMLSRKELRNCCRTVTNKVAPEELAKGKNFIKEFTPIIELKKDLLNGVKNHACRSCWNIERTGGKSPRAGIDNFAQFVRRELWRDQDIATVKTRLLDLTDQDKEDILNIDTTRMVEISLGNTCDLKCMYCHSHYSSQWAAEQIKYGELHLFEIEKELPKEEDTDFERIWWEWFETKAGYTVSAINFIGGEPLIISKFYKYIDRILNFYNTHKTSQRNVDISVVSNFNTPPKQFSMFLDCVERLVKHGKFKVDMNISMEQIGSRAEFVRTGIDWNLMTKNIETFLEFANRVDTYTPNRIIFNAQMALNALCISDLPEFIKYIIDLQRNNLMRPINLRQNQIAFPQWLSPYILPTDYTKYIDECIELIETEVIDHTKYSLYGRWDSYVTFLKGIKNGISNPDKNEMSQKDFIVNIDKLTMRRNLNFSETFPEMIEFYNECKKL
jgi:organic radical activating enzyme